LGHSQAVVLLDGLDAKPPVGSPPDSTTPTAYSPWSLARALKKMFPGSLVPLSSPSFTIGRGYLQAMEQQREAK